MFQKRRIVVEPTVMPSCGRSFSRSVWMNPRRHSSLARSDRARYDLGKPPLDQSRAWF
jgi:hypothetical protein